MNRRELITAGALAAGSTALATCTAASNHAEDVSPEALRKALSRFAVNAESWWRDIPFEERFAKAAQAGFSNVEFWFIRSWQRDAKTLARIIKPTGLKVAQIVGDTPALARSDIRAKFLDNVKAAIEDAQILGTDIVTLTGHQDVSGISREDSLKSYQDHMSAAAELFNAAKIYAAIEPFNLYNHPGHFICGHSEALRICQEINAPYMKLNWDLFHMQRHEGNLIDNIRKGHDQICYMQLADSPDRHQPGTGEIDYTNVLRACDEVGYNRPMGLELWAKDDNYTQAIKDIYALAMRLNNVENT